MKTREEKGNSPHSLKRSKRSVIAAENNNLVDTNLDHDHPEVEMSIDPEKIEATN